MRNVGPYSQEQIEGRHAIQEQERKESLAYLESLINELGLEKVTSKADLQLSPEQEDKIRYTHGVEKVSDAFFVRGTRQIDGQPLLAIIFVVRNGEDFAFDGFSPGYIGGHSCQHDFSRTELKQILEMGLNRPMYEG